MSNELEVLSADELALVVGASSPHVFLRERVGMCGCGVVPDPLHLH